MDFFDNAVNKAKEAFEVVSQKTEEVVSTQKNKFDAASIKNKRAKDFERLGEIYFNMVKDNEIEEPNVKELVDAINEKNQKLKDIEDEINATTNKKVCSSCSSLVDASALFCSNCGNKLD